MADTLQSMRDDIAEKASTLSNDLQGAGSSAKRTASDNAEALRETAIEYLEQGRARVRELGTSVQHRVQEQPVTSLLVATAIGFLIGLLCIRR